MQSTTVHRPSALKLKADLSQAFPDYQVKHPMLNKKIVNVAHGLQTVVISPKGEGLQVTSGLNLLKPWVFVVFVLLLAFTLVGGLAFYFILFQTQKEKRNALKNEITSFLNNTYQINIQ